MIAMTDNKLNDNCAMESVAEWLKKVKFKKTLFGGVDERDVWKKLDELNVLYNEALVAERARYDTLLAEAKGTSEGDGNG